MPEPAATFVALPVYTERSLRPDVVELLDAVTDVARRLNHNVLGVEHLLVVGAENGVEDMARAVPSLTAFREALLDALFHDREEFRYEAESGDDLIYLRSELAAVLDRIQAGEDAPDLLAELMLLDVKRVRAALTYARGTEPDVMPPDSLSLDRSHDLSADLSADEAAASADGAATASQSAAPNPSSGRGQAPGPALRPELPLTLDLGVDTIDDPEFVGQKPLLDGIARILLRFHQPALLIVGPAGSGKSALVRGLARAATAGELPGLEGFKFHQLRLLELVAQSHRGQDLHGLLDHILGEIGEDPKAVLVVDDLHLLVAKQGYPLLSDLIDTIKLHISKGKVRALLTVDADVYARSFESDGFFGSQITVKTLSVHERDALADIIRVYRPRLETHFGLQIEDDALEAAVDATLNDDKSDYSPPGSTVRLLDEACAMARSASEMNVNAGHVHRCHSEEASDSAHVDRKRLANIERRLATRVLGQEVAAGAVARRVRLAKLHLDRKPERPDGVFLFMGPSGVGKTEMARALARALYDDESRLVRLDMSEYMEPHSVARIIGAPPGYVGYGESGALTAPVAELGHCVVLLDEIEKAHPRVLNLFLQVFDDGRLTDSKGRLVSFAETVLIMTSNIGRELYAIHGEPAIGFGGDQRAAQPDGPVRDVVQDHLLRVLPAEFVNRIDEIVPFRVLNEEDIVSIAQRLIELEVDRWRGRGKTMTYTPEVPELLGKSGYDPRLGARHVERNLERYVISLISDAAVTDEFEGIKELALSVVDGAICLKLDGEQFVCLAESGKLSRGDGKS
ncbi:MAG: hypothetical protein DHS20C15_17980 [Planctomycetota bacterium]|nr:MAG: hypothetical protein DHS20C15_17980 [Planctomycetota bacterium]